MGMTPEEKGEENYRESGDFSPTLPQTVVLLCAQRTGSGALGSLLGKHPSVSYWGEIFHPDDGHSPQNFFHHLEKSKASLSRFVRSLDKTEMFEAYLRDIGKRDPGHAVLIDIKYSSTHHLNGAFHTPGERPDVMAWIWRRQVPVIHLKRANHLRTLVSAMLAHQSGVWHTTEAVPDLPRPIEIDIGLMLSHMAWSRSMERLFDGYVGQARRSATVEYETLFDSQGRLGVAERSEIADLLDLEPAELVNQVPGLTRQSPQPLAELISNFDEVAGALAETDSLWMCLD